MGDKWPETWRSWRGKRGPDISLEHVQAGPMGTVVNTENVRMFSVFAAWCKKEPS